MTFKGILNMAGNHSPLILTCLAGAGVVGTAYFASKAGVQAYVTTKILVDRLDEEAETHDMEPLPITKVDIFKLNWKFFIPTAIVGAATIGCVIGAHTISDRRNAALAGGYVLLDRAYKEYRDKTVSTLGEKKEEEMRAEIAQKRIDENPPTREVIVEKNGQTLCLESTSGRYFYSTKEKIRAAVNNVNLKVINDGYATQNDFYRELELPSTTTGEEFGWRSSKSLDVYFTFAGSPEGEPCLVVDYHTSPVHRPDRVW